MPKKTHQPNQAGLFGDDEGATPPASAASSLVVPFGKFKDQPADMLLANADYALWLLSAKAAMLRRSHAQLYHWLVSHFGAPDTTPEHNRLQNRFLEDDFRLQLYLHLHPGLAEKPLLSTTAAAVVEGWKRVLPSRVAYAHANSIEWVSHQRAVSAEEREAKAREKALASLQEVVGKVVIECSAPRAATPDEQARFEAEGLGAVSKVWGPVLRPGAPTFEVEGADVQFDAGGIFEVRIDEPYPEYPSSRDPKTELLSFAARKRYRVEVKPFVGDDYPVILRSMVAKNCNLLLAEAFEADGASWEQVEKVFASRNIQVARLEDVLLTPIPTYVRCLPLPFIDLAEMMRLAAPALDEHIIKVNEARAKAKARFG